MFSREEASRIRESFWTAFGLYMKPILSAEGYKINWVNYHTGLKDVYFRMDAGGKSAAIYISMEHHDAGIRNLFFEQFLELKNLLHASLEEEWEWQEDLCLENGRQLSRIVYELPGKSVFNRDQWPDLISFFKPRIIALDAFWETSRYAFEALR